MEIPETLRDRAIAEIFAKKKQPKLGVRVDDTTAEKMAEEAYVSALRIATDSWTETRERDTKHLAEMEAISPRAAERARKSAELSRASFVTNIPPTLTIFGISPATAEKLVAAIMAN